MTSLSLPKVAYVISMKNGIHSFVFRELVELGKRGFSFSIYPTKVGAGPYQPDSRWNVHSFNLGTLLWSLVKAPFQRPRPFLHGLADAVRFKAFVDFVVALDFSDRMQGEGIQRIHCHFGDHKLFIGYFCKRMLGLPLSVTIHAYELYNNPNPNLFVHALGETDEIVTVSEYNKTVLQDRFKVPDEKVRIVRLFTDKGLDEEIHNPPTDPFIVLTVSRFVEKKGHRTLFEAIAKLKDQSLRLQVVGSGPLDLRSLARDMGILEKVQFLGKVPDERLRKLYRECHVFCLPSETPPSGDKEGIPVVLMEAMAYGKPVIATRHAGIPEIVEEILINERDADGLAEGIMRLMNDEAFRLALGEKNRRIARKKYSNENMNELVRIFRGDVE